jgi:hypothetical protein
MKAYAVLQVNVRKAQQRYGLLARHTNILSALLVGLGLVTILSGVAGRNVLVGLAGGLLLLAVIVVPRPIFVVYGLTLLLPLTAGMVRGGVIPFLRVSQALLVVGFLLFLPSRAGRQRKTRLTIIDLAFALYFLTGSILPVLALFYRGDTLNFNAPNKFTGVTPLQVLLGPLQYYMLYRIVVAVISSERQLEWVLKLSFAASILVALIGILQKLGIGFVNAFLGRFYPTFNLHYVLSTRLISITDLRITSTLEFYSGLAGYLTCNMIAALACSSARKKPRISPLLLSATLVIDSIALVLTGTIAALVGLAIGVAIVFMLCHWLPRSLVFVVVGMSLTAFIFSPFIMARLNEWHTGPDSQGIAQGLVPQAYAHRMVLWKELILPEIGQHLLFGAGPAPKSSAYWSSEETQYLYLLLRGGLFYLLSYLLLIGVAIAACWRQIKQKSEGAGRTVAIATLAILVAMSVMNVSGEYFTYAGVTQVLWTFMALVIASTQFQVLEPFPPATSIGDRLRRRWFFQLPLRGKTHLNHSPEESVLPRGNQEELVDPQEPSRL